MSAATLCLWFDRAVAGGAEAAAAFYAETFADSAVGAVHRAPGDYPDGQTGDVLSVAFTLLGLPCFGINGGDHFQHTPAISFQVATDTQAETDRLWAAITGDGGAESRCGWCKDRWGISWQITPRALTRGMADSDAEVRTRVFKAMMTMRKIDIAAIEAAAKG